MILRRWAIATSIGTCQRSATMDRLTHGIGCSSSSQSVSSFWAIHRIALQYWRGYLRLLAITTSLHDEAVGEEILDDRPAVAVLDAVGTAEHGAVVGEVLDAVLDGRAVGRPD